MATLTIALPYEKAKKWYNSGNQELKKLALQAYSASELEHSNFKGIETFEDACDALSINKVAANETVYNLQSESLQMAALYKTNIIRKALNLGHTLKLTEGDAFIPMVQLVPMGEEKVYQNENFKQTKIGEVIYNSETFNVYAGDYDYLAYNCGVSNFVDEDDNSFSFAACEADYALFGCATPDIAEYFGKQFGMLIMEAKYGDLEGFEIR